MRFFILLFLIKASIFGVEPKTRIEVNPPFIGTNETAEIVITAIDQKFIKPPVPSIQSSDFDIAFINTSVVNKILSVNGKTTREKMFHYIYQLVPKNTGKFIIPAFIGTLNSGKEVYTEASQIEVKPVDYLQAQNTSSSFGGIFSIFENTPREVFLFWKLSTNNTIQNTGIIANLYIYADVPNFLRQTPYVSEAYRTMYNGGVLHEIPLKEEQRTLESGYFGTQLFYGKLYKTFVLYPLKTGSTLLSAPVLGIDQQLGNFYIQGDPVEINSYAITSNASYIGDVLSAQISLSSNQITSAGEGKLQLILTGNGNTDFFTNPLKNIKIDGLFIGEPATKVDITIDSNHSQIYMSKTFTYSIIPNKSGTFIIPALDFSFIKKTKEPVTISTPILNVEGILLGSNVSSSKNILLSKQPTINQKFYYSSGIMMIIGGILIGLMMIVWSLIKAKKLSRIERDKTYARAINADKKIAALLKESQDAITNNNLKDAARILRQSLITYCADKFGLPQTISSRDIDLFFNQKNISFPSSELGELLNNLEFHAFGQAPSMEKMLQYQVQGEKLFDLLFKIKI
ncbi:MAG: BatD family protein [Brevinema sp.]